MLNIAVIEDNDDLRSAMVGALDMEGHFVVGIDSAEAFAEQNAILSIDLMVIDLNLPGEDGISLARRIRRLQPNIGIVMVTARVRGTDRRIGYESGADIYLTKPISVAELRAAVNALSRRLQPEPEAEGLILDGQALALRGATGVIELSAPEAALLAAFARAPDRRLEVWQIIEVLDRVEQKLSRGAIRVMIFRLGRKLAQAGVDGRPIRVIRNWGYQLCEPLAFH